jgi:enoyl-CoA hydratase
MFSLRTLRSALLLQRAFSSSYENVLVDVQNRVGVVTLNRPKALNALNDALVADIYAACKELDENSDVGAIVLTGSERAFAAGADIKQMSDKTFMDCYMGNMFEEWTKITTIRKPIIAAVNGFALGGGCELAMMCDMIVCGDGAKFGQPEITLGVIPGAGGTQRLTKAVGKSKAMDLCLTGRMMGAEEAERSGLVTQVFPSEELLDKAVEMAAKIGSFSLPTACMVKETVNASFETTLQQGLAFERRLFHSLFSTEDQTEGMRAFIEKRAPTWQHK